MTRALPVILAGGSGTRLWPLSRELYPKQFLSLAGAPSLFQQTLLRLRRDVPGPFEAPLVVSNEAQRFLILEQASAKGIPLGRVILEPAARNTAPALTIAALTVAGEDPVLAMLPADHHIGDEAAFARCLRRAVAEAGAGRIATIGIRPSRAETGYGYIRAPGVPAPEAHSPETPGAYPVEAFVEKPDRSTAEEYLRSGEYLWNSGMFVMQASLWLKAIRQFRPDIHGACLEVVARGREDGVFFHLDLETFGKCPADSVDYAVMERVAGDPDWKCVVLPCAGSWSDLGSWQALWEAGAKNELENVLEGDVLAPGTRRSIILSQSRLVAALGCEDLVIAETGDAVLVARRDSSQSVADFVRKLNDKQRPEAIAHNRVCRPWGSYEVITGGDNYQVKRLTLAPGKRLSLQMHHRRSEHWIVVKGAATVVRGEEELTLHVNETIDIPRGTRHRLGNDGTEPLEVIEVQSGEYLGEDDIVRFEDDFGRIAPGSAR